MSATTSIQWTDKTWNPIRGCSVVSPGCVNCYAMKMAHRFSKPGMAFAGLTKQTKAGPQWTGEIQLVEGALLEPLSWKKPQRVFVNSMSDLFHEDVPDEFIERVFSVMALAEQHTFQILTKRPERMRAWFAARRFDVKGAAILQTEQTGECLYAHPWPLPNVWIGVSCEDQQRANERITLLLQIPAAIRFISAEPLIGAIDLEVVPIPDRSPHFWAAPALDWVIIGGESGPGARPFDLQWARTLITQCRDAHVPVFCKQIGSRPTRRVMYGPATFEPDQTVHIEPVQIHDRKGGDMSEWPKDLRVRQFPN